MKVIKHSAIGISELAILKTLEESAITVPDASELPLDSNRVCLCGRRGFAYEGGILKCPKCLGWKRLSEQR